MKSIVLILIFILVLPCLLVKSLNAQITGGPLKIDGRYIKNASGNKFQIKAVNLNDYMEYYYRPWSSQSFETVLSWLHTSEDYVRIKQMGFNSVRLNICPSHLDLIANLQRVRDHILWAKQNSLYLIIGYFSPPGSVASNGYYNENAFWEIANVNYRTEFTNHWTQIMQMCKDSGYRHVIYNFLNEPQILYDVVNYKKIYLYKTLVKNLLDFQRNISDSNLVIIDGVSYANPDYRGFNYLNTAFGSQYSNIIYDFHYYMYDFVWRRSNWVNPVIYPYHLTNGYSTNPNGFDTLTFNTTIRNISMVKILQLQSYFQPGKYRLKYLEIKNRNNNSLIFSMDMAGKTIDSSGGEKFIMHQGRKFRTNFGTFCSGCSNAQNSIMYMQNNALVFANTVKQDTNTADINWKYSYCELKYQNLGEPSPLIIPVGVPLKIKMVMDGDSLHENGRFILFFKENDSDPFIDSNQRIIQNYVYQNVPHEKGFILSSNRDRVQSIFGTINEMSKRLNKPFMLGEFAVPIEQRVSEKFTYYRDIYNSIMKDTMHWAYHAYREPHENWRFINAPDTNGSYITVSLFSGRNSTQASVSNIVFGIQTGQTSSILLPGNDFTKYYYNKSLIDTLTRLLGGSFVIPKQLNITTFIQGFYRSISDTMISDTAKIYLRDINSPYGMVDSSKGILNSSGAGSFSFQNSSNSINYYIIVKHRNSVETWSATGQSFSNGILTYNFSGTSSQAYGNNLIRVDASPLRYAIYSGDVNQDGIIDGSDQAIIDNDASNFVTGYVATDLNGDTVVDASDALIADNNGYNFVGVIRP